ncbi:MAG: transposase [Candidatus Entotheonellia bacterium]
MANSSALAGPLVVAGSEVVGDAERGDDGGKQSQRRKRHLLVDTLGLLVAILITGAGVDDGAAAPTRLAKLSPDNFPRLVIIVGDRTYHHHHLHAWMAANRPHWRLEVKRRPAGSKALPPWRNAGWWNGPTPGTVVTEEPVKTMSESPPLGLPRFKFAICISC